MIGGAPVGSMCAGASAGLCAHGWFRASLEVPGGSFVAVPKYVGLLDAALDVPSGTFGATAIGLSALIWVVTAPGGRFSSLGTGLGAVAAEFEVPAGQFTARRPPGVGVLDAGIEAPVASFGAVGIGVGGLDARLGLVLGRFEAGLRLARLPCQDGDEMEQPAGTTSYILTVDMWALTGAPKTGLAYGDVTATYVRDGQSGAAVPVALSQGVLGTWSSGGWIEVDGSGAKGLYQLGVPDAALAAGSRGVKLILEAAGAFTRVKEIQVTAVNPYDAVRGGMTALPPVVAGEEGGLAVLDAGLAVPATVIEPVELTPDYDAAKVSASQTSVDAVASAVTVMDGILDDVHDTDLLAVQTEVEATHADVLLGATGEALGLVAGDVTSIKGTVEDHTGVLSGLGEKVDAVDVVVDAVRATDVVGILEAVATVQAAVDLGALEATLANLASAVADMAAQVATLVGTTMPMFIGKVDVVDGVVDTIHGTDMAAVIEAALAAQAAAEDTLAGVAGLNDPSATDVALEVMASLVDGTKSVVAVLKRVNAFVAGDSTRTGTDPVVVEFRGEEGDVAMTQTIDVTGGERTVE